MTIGLALFSPSAALAQDPGVRVDNGPASKEYSLPLGAARALLQTRAPTDAALATTPAGATKGATQPTSGSGSATGGATNAQGKPTGSSGAATTGTARRPTATPAASSGTGDGFVTAGLALAAVALGGLAGLVLRRKRTSAEEL
jgi:hypothetical protein